MGTSLDRNFKLWKEKVKFWFQFKAFYEYLLSKAQYPSFHKKCSFQALPSCVFTRLRVPLQGLGTGCQLQEPLLGHCRSAALPRDWGCPAPAVSTAGHHVGSTAAPPALLEYPKQASEQMGMPSTTAQLWKWGLYGKDPKDHLVKPPCHRQGQMPLDQAAHSPIQPGLQHFQGWGIHNFPSAPQLCQLWIHCASAASWLAWNLPGSHGP